MNIDSDENEKDQNLKPKRKRGRPPKPKNEIQNACKELHMKKITNEILYKNIDDAFQIIHEIAAKGNRPEFNK